MNKNKAGVDKKTKIRFEKLTAAEEKRVIGSINPDDYSCNPDPETWGCSNGVPPTLLNC